MASLTDFDTNLTATVEAPPAPQPTRRPTTQQRAIFDAIADGSEHVAVSALAGTGKTTTAVGCAGVANGKRGFVAFNKHIAAELESRLGGRAKACTMHSLGFAAVRRAFGGVQLEERKPLRLLKKLFPGCVEEGKRGGLFPTAEGRSILTVSRLCKLTLTPAEPEPMGEMADYYGVEDYDDGIGEDAATLLDATAEDRSAIDFDDMIWLPVRLGLPVERFDLLMVDEVQDLSRCQQELARAACRDGRMVPIGDELQSLYGFTGADPQSMPRLIGTLAESPRSATTLPLTVTWRCPRSHVALAQSLVPNLEAAPDARDGAVIDLADDWDIPNLARPGDLVICRRNAPLVGLTFRLVAAGVPAVMIGRDFAKGLTAIIDRLKPADPQEFIRKLGSWGEREEAKLVCRDAPESQIQSLQDRVACLRYLASEADSISELRANIERLFTDTADPSRTVRLASVHRAKGSEADRVFIADPGCMPMVGRKTKAWERQQERNILYVALTRAKQLLTFAGDRPDCLK